MPLLCQKVSVCWDILCCDETQDFTSFEAPTSTLSIVNPTTQAVVQVSKEVEDACVNVLQSFSVAWDPVTGCLCTCELPATLGSVDDEHLLPSNALYRWTVTFAGQQQSFLFAIDADKITDGSYDALATDGCLPVCHVEVDPDDAPPLTDLFSARVCETECIVELAGEVAAAAAGTIAAQAAADAALAAVQAAQACCDQNVAAIAGIETGQTAQDAAITANTDAIAAIVPTEIDSADGTVAVNGNAVDGFDLSVEPCFEPVQICSMTAEPSLFDRSRWNGDVQPGAADPAGTQGINPDPGDTYWPIDTVFSGTDGDGYPLHPNTPDIVDQLNLSYVPTNNAGSPAADGQDDQAQGEFWIYHEGITPLQVYKQGATSAAVFMAPLCAGDDEMVRVADLRWSTAPGASTFKEIPLEAGFYRVRVYLYDPTSTGGVGVRTASNPGIDTYRVSNGNLFGTKPEFASRPAVKDCAGNLFEADETTPIVLGEWDRVTEVGADCCAAFGGSAVVADTRRCVSIGYEAVGSAGVTIDEALANASIGNANRQLLAPAIEFVLDCDQHVRIDLSLQLNADGNPDGAPGEFMNFGYDIDGLGVIRNFNGMNSFSPSLLGTLGATGSTIGNQELLLKGAEVTPPLLTAGPHTIDVYWWTSSAWDAGEGLTIQTVQAMAEFITSTEEIL